MAVLLLMACAGRSAEEYIRQWPTLSKKEKHAIRNECVYIEMKAMHVTGALGPPMQTCTLSTKHGTREQIVYPGAYTTAYVYVQNGKVSGIQDSRVYRLRCGPEHETPAPVGAETGAAVRRTVRAVCYARRRSATR